MAKRYDTKEDFERERLGKEAGSRRESQTYFLQTGLLGTLLGSAHITESRLYNEIKEIKGAQLNEGWLSRNWGRISLYTGLVWVALGVSSFIASFYSRSKAIKAEDALAKLGPEQVVLPPGVGCDACSPTKAYTQSIEPKTLMEQAAKSSDNAISKT